MLLLIFEDGAAMTLAGDLTDEYISAFDAGVLDVFDVSEPVTRLTPDLTWEVVDAAKPNAP